MTKSYDESTVEISYPELKELFTDILAKLPQEELRDFHEAVGGMLEPELRTVEVLSGRDRIVNDAKLELEQLAYSKSPSYPTYVLPNTGGFVETKAQFIVNSEKLTVVALLKGIASGTVYARGIAKAHPDDCFNEHIGKAIALNRALGATVPDEYLDTPQPEGARVGDVVLWSGDYFIIVPNGTLNAHKPEAEVGSPIGRGGKVIDDSERHLPARYK